MTNKKVNDKNIEENIDVENLDSDENILKLNEELLEQTKKAEEYYDRLKRNMADFDNYKKRIIKEKESLYFNVVSGILETLIPVIDNFEKAVSNECKDEKFKQGTEMIYTQIKDILTKYGVEEIKALGETFNPQYHEAVIHIDDEKYGEKEIIEVFKKGYKLKSKIIRHAIVKVAN